MAAARSAFQTPLTIKEVVDGIHHKSYLLPAIQREFVWSTDQIVRLFDSLIRDYPIGSFLFWNVEKQKIKDFQFYEFVVNYHERDSKHNPKANVTGEEGVTCVLDGQQRLTALFIGLRGTYAYKIPWKRWTSADAFPQRRLCVNLLSPAPDGQEMLYDFQFLTKEEATQVDGKTYWFEVGKALDFKDESEVNDFLIESELSQKDKDRAKFANKTLFKLFDVIHKGRIVNYYLEASQELDKVLNIFIRVNSGGTPLSYSDLLLSIATAQWKTRDARDEITRFVDELNKIGDGFNFDKDLVLKSCLVLSDIADIAFKVDNFNVSNMKTIEGKWEDITKAIRLAVELASSLGYSRETLTSNNALIPVAYFVLGLGNPNALIQSSKYKDDREKIRKWLTSSLIKRAFSGQPDNVLRPVRELVRAKPATFPLDDIVNRFRGTTKSIEFADADIENLVASEYADSHTFAVLSLLYPAFDFRKKFHEDHIFPKSSFRKPDLKKKVIPEDKWADYQENANRLANLQLLEGLPNEEKGATNFEVWLQKTFKSERERKEFMETHLIPKDIDLRFDNFLEFVKERNKLITERLRQVLFISQPRTHEASQ